MCTTFVLYDKINPNTQQIIKKFNTRVQMVEIPILESPKSERKGGIFSFRSNIVRLYMSLNVQPHEDTFSGRRRWMAWTRSVSGALLG